MKIKFGRFSLPFRFGKDKYTSSPQLLARLLGDEDGSYLLYMTLAIPIFIGFAALGTEGGLIYYNHRTVQSAADSAAYSAAIAYSVDSSADITTQAQAIVASYGLVVGTGNNQANVVATVDTTTYSPLVAINVAVTRPQLPMLSTLWSNNPFNVGGSAKAIISGGAGGGNGNCMLALAPTGTSIKLQGTPTIVAPGCGIYSNSTSTDPKNPSIDLGGNGSITGGSVGAAGNIAVGGSSNIGPPPDGYTSGDNPVINPYAGTTVPSPGACTYTDTVIKGTTATLQPGTYCTSNPNKNGAIDLQTTANVTLAPGTYILNGGALLASSQSTLTGIGVTLVFTDSSGNYNYKQNEAMNIGAGATLDLQAPSANATLGIPGMLIIGDSTMPTSTQFNVLANSTTNPGVEGVIYVPNGNFNWGGGAIIAGGCTQMIAYTITLQGNAVFNNSNCDLSGGGGGGGAKPIGNVVTLVQ